MSTFTKEALSGSTHGRGIKVAATSTPGTTIHTGPSGTDSSNEDVVTLFAYNSDTAPIVLTIEFGGTTSPDDNIVMSIPVKTGLTLVLDGLIVRNSNVIKAFAATANKVVIFGYVNRIA